MRNEKYIGRIRKGIMTECVLVLALAALVLGKRGGLITQDSASANVLFIENDYIKWVDFTVSYEALCQAYDWDVETHGTEYEIDWVELLAYTAAKTGGKFDRDALKIMDKAAEKLAGGESTLEEMTKELKYYPYYREAYDAAIGGLVGEYWEEDPNAGESSALPEGQRNPADAEKSGYIEVTPALRSAVEDKIGKLAKYFNPDTEVHVTLSVEKERQKIEVTIPVKGNIIRSEQVSNDMYVSIDLVEEIIERQLKKYKTKIVDKKQAAGSFSQMYVDNDYMDDEEIKIVRTKKFDIKPMYPEDACIQMELLGHNFYVFINAETDQVCVVYKRKGDTYGLIEPEV